MTHGITKHKDTLGLQNNLKESSGLRHKELQLYHSKCRMTLKNSLKYLADYRIIRNFAADKVSNLFLIKERLQQVYY